MLSYAVGIAPPVTAADAGVDLAAVGVSLISVFAVGLLLGAGIPVIYALGARSLASDKPGSSALGVACMSVCVVLALAGIVVIVWGKQLFGI